jgi:hypothetical protein
MNRRKTRRSSANDDITRTCWRQFLFFVVAASSLFIELTAALSSSSASSFTPIDPEGWPEKFPAKDHCSRCGLCETSFVSHVKDACAFLGEGMARMDEMEERVHGRKRDLHSMVWSPSSSSSSNGNDDNSRIAEEARFGVLHQPVSLAKGVGIDRAQWTGCVTAIALSMLESGMVDAVVCIANQRDGESSASSSEGSSPSWSSSEPILAKTSADVLRGRGVKPALAPSLRVLDDIQKDKSIRKLLFCGVGCAVQGKFSFNIMITFCLAFFTEISPSALNLMYACMHVDVGHSVSSSSGHLGSGRSICFGYQLRR